jgi:hypothetical protein
MQTLFKQQNNLSQIATSDIDINDYEMNVDYCVDPGTYSYTTNWGEEYYFNSDNYQSLSAEEKMANLWTQITENDAIVCQTFDGLTDLFRQRPN